MNVYVNYVCGHLFFSLSCLTNSMNQLVLVVANCFTVELEVVVVASALDDM